MTRRNLAEYLEENAARRPDRLAVVDPSGRSATYATLNRQADALAGYLSTHGVQRGDRVGVVLPKGISSLVAFFGIMKARAAYVPVDYTAPVERGRRILTDCQISALVVDHRSLDIVPTPALLNDPLRTVIVAGAGPAPPTTAADDTTSLECILENHGDLRYGPSEARTADDLAYIIYTSGSTGMPKGAMITHRNAFSFVEWCSSILKPTEDDRFSAHTPFHFDASVQDIYLSIKHGSTLYLISEELGRNSRRLVQFIAEHQLTFWTSTPSTLIKLMQFGNIEAHDASSVRVVTFGGEVFPVKHLRALQRCWPRPVYYNMYGPTETTTACTFARIPSAIPDDRETPYPIGFPCSHCRALVLDDEGREAAAGMEGNLHISGPSVFAGYWNRPEETAAAVVDRAGTRWYNTGDIVRWDPAEGFVYVGRKDGMVKRRGFRIDLGEIEHSLHSHGDVHEAAVVSVPDADSSVKIVAFLSCHANKRPSVVDLKTFCATKLPTYMSPDRFVFLDRLPRTSTDKVDYQTLKKSFAATALVGQQHGVQSEHTV
jgi:amino acid adenylation domain-containing protein